MKNALSFIGLILLAAFTGWILMTYVFVSDEERILRIIEKGRRAVESGSTLSLNSLLSADYLHEGRIDKRTAIGGLRRLFQETDDRRIQLIGSDVSVDGDQASAIVEFTFDAEGNANFPPGVSPGGSESRRIELEFERSRNRWRISASRVL